MVGKMDDSVVIKNENGCANSLQVSVLQDVPEGTFSPGRPFVVKNITDDAIQASVRLVNQENFVTTQIYPGWNPELLIEIEDVEADTLQYGY